MGKGLIALALHHGEGVDVVLAEVLGEGELHVAHEVIALYAVDVSPSVSVELTLAYVVGDVSLKVDVSLGVRAKG